MKTSLLTLLAFAACVKIPNNVEATFAGPSAQEDSYFRRNANGAPHVAFEHVPHVTEASEDAASSALGEATDRDGGVD